jgi:predicted transcriptional regulator of viral defense system
MKRSPGNLPQGRAQLVGLLSEAADVIHLDDVVSALPPDRTAAAQHPSRWVEQGWPNRVGRGAYVAASIDTMGSDVGWREVLLTARRLPPDVHLAVMCRAQASDILKDVLATFWQRLNVMNHGLRHIYL